MKFIAVVDITRKFRATGGVLFRCDCDKKINITNGGDIKECKCGRKYRIAQYVEIEEK